MLTTIISGGQTGADRAALMAAKDCGLQTGGWMPKGFRAQDGMHPEFAELYNIKEHSSPLYPPRTTLNVKESDATVRFASNWDSKGELLTLKMIEKYDKPYLDIDILENYSENELLDFIEKHRIIVLNVAGNSENTTPGIQEYVYAFLHNTLNK